MKITFKAKQGERQIFKDDGSMPIVRGYYIPKITRKHCDMSEARQHPKYSGLANSDLFERIIDRDVKAKYGDFITLDAAKIAQAGFLDTIILDV